MTLLTASAIYYSRNNQPILHNVSFSLTPGSGLVVMGANGKGKSTLLRIVAGLLMPDSGEMYWQGKAIHASENYQQNRYYVGHKLALKQGLTVKENFLLSQQLYNQPSNLSLLELFELAALQDRLTASLSAGQKQRLALACVVGAQAKLWILDEPFSALDEPGQHLLQTCLAKHLEQEGTCLIASHQKIPLTHLAVLSL